MDKKILGINELSDYLGISDRTIRCLIKDNEIPYFRLRNLYKFDREAIDLWINSNMRKKK